MLNYFITKVDLGKGGFYYKPTTLGSISIVLLIILLLFLISLIRNPKSPKKINTKQMIFASLAMALAVVASMIKLFKLPMEGSLTLFSMLFITLIGFWYGPKIGIMTSIGYGLLQLFIEPYILSLPQLILDYILAFGSLGLSGFMCNRKHGLYTGYLIGILGRYFFAILSGGIFFTSYAPDTMNPWIYSILYNGSYIGAEAVLTLILISLPPVKKALNHVKILANE